MNRSEDKWFQIGSETYMIKAIIFDLGGVLFTNGTGQFIDRLVARYNLDRDQVKNVIDGGIGTLYREAKISRDEFWKKAIESLGIVADADTLEEDWIRGYELIQGTKDLIVELTKQYKIYYLSDNVKERVEKLNERYDFLRWFAGGIFSHEVGVRKPDPRLYRLILDNAKVFAPEALYIDDKPRNLEPARDMGMATILFESPEKILQQVKEKLMR